MDALKAGIVVVWLGMLLRALFTSSILRAGSSRKMVLLVFSLKLIAGALLWLIYTQHYTLRNTSDSFRYFDDAMVLNGYLFNEPGVWIRFFLGIDLLNPDLDHVHEQLTAWQSSYNYGIASDNPTIIRLNMLIGLVSAGGYATHVLFMCFIALMGHLLFARGVTDLIAPKADATPAFIGSTLFPTVLFWGSGVLKEVPLIFAMGLLFFGLSGLNTTNSRRLLWLVPAVALMTVTKPYVLITLAPALVGLALCMTFKWRVVPVFGVVATALFFMAVHASAIYQPGGLLYILAKKQTDFYNVAEANNAGSTVTISPVADHAIGFLADLPERLTLTYLRPFPFEARGLLQYAAVAENLVFIMLLFYIFRLTAGMKQVPQHRFRSVVAAGIIFAVVFGMIAGSTVPVMGAMVRYKLPVLMVLGGIAGAGMGVLRAARSPQKAHEHAPVDER